MIALRHPKTTRVVGKAQGYLGLPLADQVTEEGHPVMATLWEPTPAELEQLNAGGRVELLVAGRNHPPVLLRVKELACQECTE
jgi:hypothetical protein